LNISALNGAMQRTTHQTCSFGDFTLDLTLGCLLRAGKEIKLRPQTFQTLKFLVKNSGRLISKDELIKEVWPEWNASDNQLARCLSEVRHALGEEEPHYIKTVPRRGYIFDALVEEESPTTAIYTEQVEGVHVIIDEEEDDIVGQRETVLVRSNRGYLSRRLTRHMTALVIGLATMFGGIAFALYKFITHGRSTSKPGTTFQTMKISRLTNTGEAVDAAVSPDGKYVVNVVANDGHQSLWMRQVVTGSDVQIVPPADVEYEGLTFSRDGNYLYYGVWDKKNTPIVLYQMPVLGGPARKVVDDIDSVITFSPDSKRFAFLRGYPALEGNAFASALVVASIDGSKEQKLSVLKFPDFFSTQGDAPTWSPDGKTIACPAGKYDAGGPYMTVLGVNVEDGAVKPLTTQRWRQVGRMAWLKDGEGLILSAKEQEASPSQLWYLAYPDGDVHRITNDLNDYEGVSLTANSNGLVTVQSEMLSNIWLEPGGDVSHATQIPSNTFDGIEGIFWTPDDKIVYAARSNGSSDIWIVNRDGKDAKQLTAGAGNNSWPTVSADGRYIVFMSDRGGGQHIWRMDMDGQNPQRLTNGGNEWYPDCSPDGQWVVYVGDFGKRALWKAPIKGGDPVQVIDKTSARPAISPDGKSIATSYFGDSKKIKTAIYSFEGGEPIKILDIWNFYKSWTPDGRALAYVDPRNSSNVTIQPIDGQPPRQLTSFKDKQVFRFTWSRDGKWLALVRGVTTNDAVLISNFK